MMTETKFFDVFERTKKESLFLFVFLCVPVLFDFGSLLWLC